MTPPAGMSQETASVDNLFAGSPPRFSRKITLLSGENRTRGAVLGIVAGAVSAPVAFAGNTGDGTFAATPTVGAGVEAGDYKLIVIEPAAGLGTFMLNAPSGKFAGRGVVGTAFAGPLAFTLNDGGTDFIAGDGFTITVAVGTKYKLSASAAADGSHVPDAVLAQDCDATAGDKEALIYVEGLFSQDHVTLGAGHTVATVREGLRQKGIHLVKAQEA